jgi:asparagine synthase (glutamine-hydrolysing)
MCGIAGTFGIESPSTACIHECLDMLKHRGPDDQGWWQAETRDGLHVSLLHTRLSIIDVDGRAAQPMIWRDWALAFNGELYNYRELRSHLEGFGLRFRTTSDTEVLLKGIATKGWAFLDDAEGMWALSAYCSSTGVLSLSRDRFGEKPLCFSRGDKTLAFASEVGVLERLLGEQLRPDLERLRRFMVFGYKASLDPAGSFLERVEQVPPGHILHFSSHRQVSDVEYWNPIPRVGEQTDFATAARMCREHLVNALDLRLRSDAPLAFSLSGGVDSVVLAGIARRELNQEVFGFTIANSDARYQEINEVNAAVEFLGVEHDWIGVTDSDPYDRLIQMVGGRGAPVLTLSSFAQSFLMEAIAARGFKVVVGGTAADELFGGYYDHHLFYIASLAGVEQERAEAAWRLRIMPFVRNPLLRDGYALVRNPRSRDHVYLGFEQFNELLVQPLEGVPSEREWGQDPLRNRLLNEMFHETVPVLLQEEDANAMRVSLENRSPYLDRQLYEFVNGLPVSLLVQEGYTKALLRSAGRDYAPESVLWNPRKVGFNVPLSSILDLQNRSSVSQLLEPSQIWDLVDRDKFADFVASGADTNSRSKFVFSVLSCKAFLDVHG